jgi:hypothetical protein
MALSRNLRPALTPLRLTLAIALMAVASSGYVVFVAPIDTPSTFELALVRPPQPIPCRMSGAGQGRVSFATAFP